MSHFTDLVEASAREHSLLRDRQRILVAVSGGVDSMVLLDVLHELSRAHHWRLILAHFNHQLRGRSSDADERFVGRAARDLGLPIIVDRGDVRGYSREQKVSLEMAARELRHEFLARAARRARCAAIALAHHADDQVELFFLRLLRGSSGSGLGGMKWISASPANPAVTLVRPMLGIPKDQLLGYAREKGIRFREDRSNASLDIQRNRLRHELLPLLRRGYQPALTRTILRLMELTGKDAEAVSQTAEEWLRHSGAGRGNKAQARGEGATTGPLKGFIDLPIAVQRRCIQAQLYTMGVEPDFESIEYLRLQPGRPITIPGGELRVARGTDGLLYQPAGAAPQFRTALSDVQFNGDKGAAIFDNVRIKWRISQKRLRASIKAKPGQEKFDAAAVGSRVVLRHWKPGDRFQPIGMRRSVKLQDLFTNLKVPRDERRKRVVAATAAGEIFWVEGVRISERYKLERNTRQCLHWSWQRDV